MGQKPITWLADRLLDLSGLLLFVMMVHVCADVGLKYLLNMPIQGTLEIVSYYYMVCAVFLPLAVIELNRNSVAVELFFNMMPKPLQIACIGLVLAICVAVYFGVARITWFDAIRSFNRSEVVMGPVTVVIWPTRFVLPVSFALAGLICLWHLIRLVFSAPAREELTRDSIISEEGAS